MVLKKLLWSLPTVCLFLMIYHGYCYLESRKSGGKNSLKYWRCMLIAYFAVLFTATLDLDRVWVCLFHGWPIPAVAWFDGDVSFAFFDNGNSFQEIVERIGNIILFIPFGLLSPLCWNGMRFPTALLSGFCLSALIESIQFVVGRNFDVKDIGMNTAGAFLGWVLWKRMALFEKHSLPK